MEVVGGDHHIERGAVWRDRAALKSREGRGPAEGIAQLLIAVAVEGGVPGFRRFGHLAARNG